MSAGKPGSAAAKYHLKGQAPDGTLPQYRKKPGLHIPFAALFRRPPEAMRRLNPLLKDVSRSFYLTLKMLPDAICPQIGLTYLLARATDTIADTGILPWQQRLITLRMVRDRILGTHSLPLEFDEDILSGQSDNAERELLMRVEEIFEVLQLFGAEDQALIQEVLATIISGQELDLERFGSASSETLIAIQTHKGLEDYTYRVAGCVGVFWTRMIHAHLFRLAPMYESLLLKNGVWFGQGLQLVNILRDLPVDLQNGRCYFPMDRLAEVDLKPGDLLDPDNEERFRPIYDAYLDFAEARLAAGWEYTNALPRKHRNLRLACAWPILIGKRTIDLLRTSPVLDPEHCVKIPRSEVYNIIMSSTFSHSFSRIWNGQFRVSQRMPA